MTIIAFHYTEDSIFAISDGLISRGVVRVVDENKKIVAFDPVYKIPRVSLGRLDGFDKYSGGRFCICYAGNYTLISTVVSNFLNIVTNKLVLERGQDGVPTVYWREDEGRGLNGKSYWDDYNFSHNELIPITVNFLSNILQKTVDSTCINFAKNAGIDPDIELILFGKQCVGYKTENKAQVIYCKRFDGSGVEIERFSILPWSLACLGDPSAIREVIQEIESDPLYNKQSITLKSNHVQSWMDRPDNLHDLEVSRTKVIKRVIMPLIQRNLGSIGGDCTIATSGWASEISLSTIKSESLESEIRRLIA